MIELVYDRMFKSFTTELFKTSKSFKENGDTGSGNSHGLFDYESTHQSHSNGKKHNSSKKRKSQFQQQTSQITREQFCYKMDDGNLISKYLLEPNFLRELYLFELATTVALIKENMLSDEQNYLESGVSVLDSVGQPTARLSRRKSSALKKISSAKCGDNSSAEKSSGRKSFKR